MPTVVVTKKERPPSSGAAKISAAANVYNAMKTKELAAGQKELILSNKQLVGSNHRQEQILTSLDFGMRQLESLTEESNKVLKVNADTQKEQLKETKRANQKQETRAQIKDLKEELKEQKELEIQALKDMTHAIYREQQTICHGLMTNLEKLFTLEKLKSVIVSISSQSFPDTPDKLFRDKTQDEINEKLKQIEGLLTPQDKADLNTVIAIEKQDENAQALKLLTKLNVELSKTDDYFALIREINNKKELSKDNFDKLKVKIEQFRKKAKL
jgi:hypothetical protein